jgi:uncharacterized membrane protein
MRRAAFFALIATGALIGAALSGTMWSLIVAGLISAVIGIWMWQGAEE